MLELKNVTKIYKTGDIKQKALNNITINFRKNEFAAILGPSGSGKTTLLNIIGGLDHYTSGNIIVNETSTKKYKDSDWDSYRNHRIGFIFQSYNLISHQTILKNVMLALTLSGISKKESTRRAKKALEEVGLGEHINKRPNQLSGGQMQRVAIARALVNDPEILLADEPTGALDSETSIQIMDLLKKIAENRLVIMVTHNPDLAEQYATRIITLKDGKILDDTNSYDGKVNTKEAGLTVKKRSSRTKMSFFTALGLSFDNLMTKKGRTILVAFAGSIGIIGIALILALSNGFQRYVDQIQEETLSSYPLTITQQSADITSMLLSMNGDGGESNDDNSVIEKQYISEMFASLSTNDLKGLKKHLEEHYDEIKDDVSTIKYGYSIDPLIYTKFDNKITKLNPSTAFSSFYGSSSLLSSYSSYASIYSQMIDDKNTLEESYDVLAGHWPENYNEMIIVLPSSNQISDLLVYSLGLRDPEELNSMISKIMSGETVGVVDPPLKLSYEDLMNVELKLIMPSDLYQYNSEYKVYEDLSENIDFMAKTYDNATKLKVVGIVSAKEDSSSMALNPGVAYTSDLIKHIINYSKNANIVKDQLGNEEVDVFSGTRFDEKKSAMESLNFSDLITVDNEKLKSAFNININENTIKLKTADYMSEIAAAITTDTTPAANTFISTFDGLASGLKLVLPDTFESGEIDGIVDGFLVDADPTTKTTFVGLLKSVLTDYLTSGDYDASIEAVKASPAFIGMTNMAAKTLTEATMKQTILMKVGELTAELSKSFASAFKVDPEEIASAFQLSMSEEEITRIVTALMSDTEATATSNLISLGYQDLDSPTQISFYFSSFEGKENFLAFLDQFDDIKYSDTTGILMNSVKTIVNAVSYALIGFVSVSLVVSSIMIGIITYISVYERTKEIGILRAIGASKRNVSSIFNAETFIIGLLSGLFGIGISYGSIIIINLILNNLIPDVPLRAVLFSENAGILVVLSIILTLIGGFIPSKSASKKDPVEALRSE